MSGYTHATRPFRIADLPVAVRNAIVTLADQKKLKLVDAQAWLTLGTKPAAPSLLGKLLRRPKAPPPAHETVLVLLPTHLLVGGSYGVVADAFALCAPLAELSTVKEPDGLVLQGFRGAKTAFTMKLGPGADAEACRVAAEKAIADAKATPAP